MPINVWSIINDIVPFKVVPVEYVTDSKGYWFNQKFALNFLRF
jgi:hypothetical protein